MSERLTEEELYSIEDLTRAYDTLTLPHHMASSLVKELRARRAADLKPDECDLLRTAALALEDFYQRDLMQSAVNGEAPPGRARVAQCIALVDRLITGATR